MSYSLNTKNLVLYLEKRMADDTQFLFWFWQVFFWVLVSIVSFLTLTVWYKQFELNYIGHTILQGLLGFIITQGLYVAFKAIWENPIIRRLSMGFLLVLISSFVWTAGRIQAFEWMTVESHVWADFGGWYFGSIFIFLCWAGMFHGIRYYKQVEQEHKDTLKAEAEAKDAQLQRIQAQAIARDAQLKMLRYQLNPHFLCNTLNAINALVEAKMSDQAQEMAVKLSKFLRYSLDNNPDTKIALKHELRAMNLYLDIEKARFGERLKMVFDIAPEALNAVVPSLLVQPIIENSMKHAIAKSETGGLIGIQASVVDDCLKIELYDSGSGARIAKTKIQSFTGRGVGLRNTGERLKTLYGEDFSFNISIEPSGGLRTIIKIPFEAYQ